MGCVHEGVAQLMSTAAYVRPDEICSDVHTLLVQKLC
jgi:hypothetical protein